MVQIGVCWAKKRPRKAKRSIVCKSPSREGSTAVGEVVDPLRKDLKTSKGKIQDQYSEQDINCFLQYPNAESSLFRQHKSCFGILERSTSTSTEFAVCLITESSDLYTQQELQKIKKLRVKQWTVAPTKTPGTSPMPVMVPSPKILSQNQYVNRPSPFFVWIDVVVIVRVK